MRGTHLLESLRGFRPESFHLPTANRVTMLAPLVGILAGIGAVLFQVFKTVIDHYALIMFAGYDQGGPRNEGQVDGFITLPETLVHDPVLWALILVPAAGGLVVGLLTYWIAPEAAGGGADSAIDAYHNRRGHIRLRATLIKLITTPITLGTGGSGGAEGPIALIGAGVGSALSTRLRLTDTERRVLMAAGLGAGIGAFFRAPLAGAIFAAEVLYRDPDFEAEVLIPAFFSTTAAYCVFCLVFGFGSLFHVEPMVFENPAMLGPLTVLALVMTAASLVYVKVFHISSDLFARMPGPIWIRPAIGGLATGIIGGGLYFAFLQKGEPENAHHALAVFSFGYGFLQNVLANPMDLSLLILLIVGFGKIFTTSFTIGSGGSGGMFGPSMVIGGSLGTVVGMAFHGLAPNLVSMTDLPVFALLGMAAFFGAAASVPVSTLIMVSEITGSYEMLLPAMWVCALAYITSQRWTLYREQAANRRQSPAHRGDFVIDVLEGMTVKDAMSRVNREFITVELDLPLREMDKLITNTNQICFPVVDTEKAYYGVFGLNDMRQFLYDDTNLAMLAVAQDLAVPSKPLTLQMDLSSAMAQFAQGQFEELPVVDESEPKTVIGLMRRQDLISAYSSQLLAMRSEEVLKKPSVGG